MENRPGGAAARAASVYADSGASECSEGRGATVESALTRERTSSQIHGESPAPLRNRIGSWESVMAHIIDDPTVTCMSLFIDESHRSAFRHTRGTAWCWPARAHR